MHPHDPSRPGSRPGGDALQALVVAVGSRVASLAAAAFWVSALHFRRHDPALADTVRGLLIHPWYHKDAVWFLRIAEDGYGFRPGSAAFFPLYPLLVRLAGSVRGHWIVVAIALSLLFYAVAMLALYSLVKARFGTRVAAIAVMLVAVYPTAFVFNAPYSESLFLMLTVGTFWLAERRRWLLAGLAGMLAALTRGTGVVLIVPLVLLYAEQRGWTWRRLAPLWPRDLRLASVLLVALGPLLYLGYLSRRFGHPVGFMAAEQRRWGRSLGWPTTDIVRDVPRAGAALRAAWRARGDLWHELTPGRHVEILLVARVFPLAAFGLVVGLIAAGWRRLPASYTAFAVLSALFPLLFPTAHFPLMSYHRFVMLIFPLFITAGLLLKDRPVLRWGLIAASFALMFWLAGAYAVNTNAV